MKKETISINKAEARYEIDSIIPIKEHILKIVFTGDIPETFGDIQVYTAGGILCSDLPGYSTVYRDDRPAMYLSDDGSVYQEPEPPEEIIPPERYVSTLEELQAVKKAEISANCEKAIYKGISVTLSDGKVEHFSLTEHDQINLFGKQAQLAAGAEKLEYHADGQPCRYYSAEDMLAIIQSAMWHVSYHTTYCNALNMWVVRCQTADEMREIFYGVDVPDEYRSEVLDAYLLQIAAMAGDTVYESTS